MRGRVVGTGSDALSVVELVKVVAGVAGFLNPQKWCQPESEKAGPAFSLRTGTTGLTERQGSQTSDIAFTRGEAMPISKGFAALGAVGCAILFLLAAGAGAIGTNAFPASATSDNI